MQFLPFTLKPRRKKEGPDYADLYPRAAAAAIDLTLLFLILNHLFQLISAHIFQHVDQSILRNGGQSIHLLEFFDLLWSSNLGPLWLLNMVVQVGIIGLLLVTTQILWGTTPGKWVFGLKIVRAETLEPLSAWRYILRFFAYIPAMMPLLIGIFWVSFNRQRRGWHDYIAGTVVIGTRPFEWYWGHFKRLCRRLYNRMRNRPSGAVEQAVGEPPSEKRQQDGSDPVG